MILCKLLKLCPSDNAKKIAETKDSLQIEKLLLITQKSIFHRAHFAIKTLKELSYLNSGMLAPYSTTFLSLLEHTDKVIVAETIAILAEIAYLNPDKIHQQLKKILFLVEKGDISTKRAGMKLIIELGRASSSSHHELRDLFGPSLVPPNEDLSKFSLLATILTADDFDDLLIQGKDKVLI